MKASLARFFKEYGLQLRLIVGHWSYWVMHAVFAVLLFALFSSSPNDGMAEDLLTASFGTISTGLIILVCTLLAGMTAARASQSRFSELAESFPTGSEVLVGGCLASLTAGMGLLLEPVALAAYFGPFDSLLAGLYPFCGYTLAGALVGVAFTWWLAGWLKFRRWIYPLLAATWAAAWLGPMFLARAGIKLSLLDIPTRMQNADYDNVFGRLEPPALAGWFCVFIAAFGTVWLSWAVCHLAVRRHHRLPVGTALGTILVLAVCIFSGLQFTNTMNHLHLLGAQNPDSFIPASQPHAAKIESYDVSVDMTAAGQPQISVEFTLRNLEAESQDTWILALNHNFKVLSASVPFVHNQDTLRLQLPAALVPQEQTQISLTYQGTLTTYSEGPQIPVANQFLDGHKARLGLYAYWLPVAGNENLKMLANMGSLAEPVSIHLTLKTPHGVNNYTNLTQIAPGEYSSPAASWVFWAASSRLAEQSTDQLRVYGIAGNLEKTSVYIDEIDGFYRSLQSLFPTLKVQPASLLMFDTRNGMAVSGVAVTDQRPVLVVPYFLIANWGHSESSKTYSTMSIGSYLLDDFYQLSGGSTLGGEDLDVLGRFLWLNNELKGDPSAIRNALFSPRPLAEVLLRVLENSGQAGLAQAVETLRQAPANPENEEAVALWLKARLNVQ
jgi:hypothetical protein